ncbi:hypothetical protein [Kordiimonas sp. SCSIO 12610]|uniref:hypothetical protein n=1 Tax=Kordiimonas sp. SCSIO 12610 TaxID=2829597 RepID=UPI00210CDDF6|nr:hypothetical protein [Kordiimonas sp. SCSIO 12610]UTW55647.1 hypothetical protein KFF44_01760 [Kordiimonas sp. SCSIO 12610]
MSLLYTIKGMTLSAYEQIRFVGKFYRKYIVQDAYFWKESTETNAPVERQKKKTVETRARSGAIPANTQPIHFNL